MTFLEKLKQDRPDIYTHFHNFGCLYTFGCPKTFGYENEFPKGCTTAELYCSDCWNREIPEEKETYSHEEVKMMCDIADDVVERFNEATGEYGPKIHINPEWVANVQESVINSIKDSGDRTEFATGAVRDMHEGKGRCDLLPLDVLTHLYNRKKEDSNESSVFYNLHHFQRDGQISHLTFALYHFHPFYDLETMLLETAVHFEDGAKKYGEYNWQKGIPVNCYIDSAVRHYLKYLRGDEDERHDRAFVWNILCCIWTCKHKPELNTYLKKENEDENRSDC